MSNTLEPREVVTLYHELLEAWNRRDAKAFADFFSEDADLVGFDGSEMSGRAQVEIELGQIFAHHETAAYVAKVRGIRRLGSDVAILHGVAGMVPPGKSELGPDRNAVQILVARRTGGRWRIESYQNTPAAFHGRPELSRGLTEELTEVLHARAAEASAGGSTKLS